MPRPRTPAAKARATGRDTKNPARFEGRNEPIVHTPIGEPPTWIQDTDTCKARTAWNTFRDEIPWLNSSHRSILEIASTIRGRMIAGQECGVQAMNLLRQALGQLGATPADASKAGAMPSGDEARDPTEQYF